MSDTNGFSTQEEIDAAFEQLRTAHDAQSAGPAFDNLTRALGAAGLLPRAVRQKGRTPEPLPTYTFENGATATVHRVGQMTIAHIAATVEQQIDQIPIPTFATDMGAGLVEQPNIASKEYQADVAARRGKVNLAVMDALIDLAIDIEIDQAEVERVKSSMERIGMPLHEVSDKVLFIKHCCVTDGSELAALSKLIQGNMEVAVAAQTATFSGDVPGETAVTLESAPIRRQIQSHA